MSTYSVQPRVYVACLAAYNDGHLHGKWIDADDGVDALWEGINEVLKSSPIPGAEEWAIHDHEYLGDIGEYESVETDRGARRGRGEHGEAFLAFLKACDSTEEATSENFEERYQGEWESERAYAENQVEELGLAGISPGKYVPKGAEFDSRLEVNVLEELSSYLDWDAIERSIFDHGDYTYVDGFVFRDY